jgi:hypothetical protein
MKRLLWHIGILMVVIGLLAGCRIAQIYHVNNTAVGSSPSHTITLEQVEKTIIAAGFGLGWAMEPTAPGHIQGTLHLRDHTAVVDIPYSTHSYSITYNSSDNLEYDPSDGTIHKNYNSWIQNLDNAIKARLSFL